MFVGLKQVEIPWLLKVFFSLSDRPATYGIVTNVRELAAEFWLSDVVVESLVFFALVKAQFG